MSGHVPQPPYIEHYEARVNAIAGVNCTEMSRTLHGTAWHTEQGWFLSTANFFTNPYNGALTDFQIGGPWDGDQYDGVIMRFIEADQGVVPWANGVVGAYCPPYDEGKTFIDTYVRPTGNMENTNAMLRSIELSDGGMPDRDRELTGRQIESLAFLTAYVHAEEAGQTAGEFASNILHCQTGCAHQQCPGSWVKQNKALIRARAIEIMRAYQDGVPMSRPLVITYPPGWSGGKIAQPVVNAEVPKVTYPAPFDHALCADIWACTGSPAAKTYPYNETGAVSTVYRNTGKYGPLLFHFKDTATGREIFTFSQYSIVKDKSGGVWRVM